MTDRKDKGKAMKPPADATHCGGYPIDTPTPDNTSVAKGNEMTNLTAPRQDATLPPPIGYVDQAEYAALSAKLEAAEAKLGHFQKEVIDTLEANEADALARAEAAEAELAAYREMHAEINAQGGPNVVRLQMQACRDRIRAEAAEAERDAALGAIDAAFDAVRDGLDADAFLILKTARQKGSEG